MYACILINTQWGILANIALATDLSLLNRSTVHIHSESGVATNSQPIGSHWTVQYINNLHVSPSEAGRILHLRVIRNSQFYLPRILMNHHWRNLGTISALVINNQCFYYLIHKGHIQIPWIVLHQLWNQLWCLVDMCKNNLNACSVLMKLLSMGAILKGQTVIAFFSENTST